MNWIKQDREKQKNENLGLELINTVNENKAVNAELGNAYKTGTNKTEENAQMLNKIDTLTKALEETKEAQINSI